MNECSFSRAPTSAQAGAWQLEVGSFPHDPASGWPSVPEIQAKSKRLLVSCSLIRGGTSNHGTSGQAALVQSAEAGTPNAQAVNEHEPSNRCLELELLKTKRAPDASYQVDMVIIAGRAATRIRLHGSAKWLRAGPWNYKEFARA